MDIYLTRVGGSGDFRFPSLPEKIKASYGTNYETYNIINIGQEIEIGRASCRARV